MKALELHGRGGREANIGEELRAEREEKNCTMAMLPKGIDVEGEALVVLKP